MFMIARWSIRYDLDLLGNANRYHPNILTDSVQVPDEATATRVTIQAAEQYHQAMLAAGYDAMLTVMGRVAEVKIHTRTGLTRYDRVEITKFVWNVARETVKLRLICDSTYHPGACGCQGPVSVTFPDRIDRLHTWTVKDAVTLAESHARRPLNFNEHDALCDDTKYLIDAPHPVRSGMHLVGAR